MAASTNRREFLKKAAAAGLGLSVAGHLSTVQGKGAPSEKIIVAVMGVNSRGNALAKTFAQVEGSEVAYIADVDERAMRKTVEDVSEIQGRTPEGIGDFRRALDDEAVDALVIATPDHWHAPAAILGLKAGKHIYVEKPCSHNPREGELLVETQRTYDRVVQMGNGRRSLPNVIEAIGLLKAGEIGPVHYARCWYARSRDLVGEGRHVPVPAWLDWELWQGPAPRKPFQDRWVHYNWHWFRHWGTGEAGNNGVHTLDLARWGLQADYPVRVTASGGHYEHDNWQFPDGQMLTFEFEGGKMATWEGISFNEVDIHGESNGVVFQGEEGSIAIPSGNNYKLFDGEGNKVREAPTEQEEAASESLRGSGFDDDQWHARDFLSAIRTGERPNSYIEGGHKSTLLCHLANIAHRTGRTLECDPENGHIVGDEGAMQLWSREYAPDWEPTV